ncbi:MAG TPA: outer membrane lipoprotein carrier protein LolA [Thermoanaerobaculia bacterium]|jgi:outer membrane lipoprotein-sorting protein|nr:outer membrane lipoprotein carrier protein LolA [Thermoanaerobaculia bacterium]
MKHLVLLLSLSALILPSFAPAASAAEKLPDPKAPGLDGNARLKALVDRVKIEQSHLKTLEAKFTQTQQSAMLVTPETSTGGFSYAAPDRVRWEYATPNPISVVIKGEEMTTWYHDLKRADLLKIGRYSNQVFKYLGASGNMDSLVEYFTVRLTAPPRKGAPYQMELIPRFSRISKRIKSMTLWIDDETFLPVRLKYVEADGDWTDYKFSDMKKNAGIPEDRFVLKIPKGVETRVIDLGQQAKSDR